MKKESSLMYILCIYEMSVLFCAKQSFVSCDATIIHIFNILPLVCSCYFGWIIVHHIFLYYTPNLMLSLGFVKVILGMLKLTWESSLSKAGAIPPPLPLPWSLPYSETYSFSLFFFLCLFFFIVSRHCGWAAGAVGKNDLEICVPH